ncbi:MAG: hypothetical protein M3R24_13250 [Chloroflexota bacterium]|nr:hypothetical protein [Chloroflexota bacterium]
MKQPDLITTVVRYWRITIGLGLVVIGAVALLLTALARTAEQIEAGVAEIWRVGKLLANNTVHVALLIRTNQIIGAILPKADGIAAATARIQRAIAGDETEGPQL